MPDAVQAVADLQERLTQREKQLVECDRAMSKDGILRPGGMLVGHWYLVYVDYCWVFGKVEAMDLVSPAPSLGLSNSIVMSPVNTEDVGFVIDKVRGVLGPALTEGQNYGSPSGSALNVGFVGELIVYLKALNWAIPMGGGHGLHGILEPHGKTQIQASQGSEVT